MIPNPAYYLAHGERHRQRAALIGARAFGGGKPVEEDETEEAPESPR